MGLLTLLAEEHDDLGWWPGRSEVALATYDREIGDLPLAVESYRPLLKREVLKVGE